MSLKEGIRIAYVGMRWNMDLQLVHISKAFGQKQVLNNINITFHEGQIHCLLGASGIGKTTVLNLLMGICKPDEGMIIGQQGQISAVFQEDRVIEHWDAFKNVRLVCRKSITDTEIEQNFKKVGLIDIKGKPVNALSGGMRRRVAIVRSMLADGNLILMDEPFKGLDMECKRQVIEYIKEEAKGKTLIVVTHEAEDVVQLEAEIIQL